MLFLLKFNGTHLHSIPCKFNIQNVQNHIKNVNDAHTKKKRTENKNVFTLIPSVSNIIHAINWHNKINEKSKVREKYFHAANRQKNKKKTQPSHCQFYSLY